MQTFTAFPPGSIAAGTPDREAGIVPAFAVAGFARTDDPRRVKNRRKNGWKIEGKKKRPKRASVRGESTISHHP